MRKALVDAILKKDDPNTYFLTADVGYHVLEPIQSQMGSRFINIGISEQTMISVASGLALSGKTVYTYTMCAFYLRAIEQIRNDICYQDVPVVMLGVGTGFDYGYLGTTHFAHEDADIIGRLANMQVYTPKTPKDVETLLREDYNMPTYIRVGYDHKELKLDKYPKEGGSKEYFIKKYHENKKQKVT